jgi:hypothetical protein
VRAPARKPRWLNPAPCTVAKGMYLVGVRKQELPGAALLGNAVDVIWKRNGGEHAWSFCRCPGCIGCEQTDAKRDGGQKRLGGHGAFQFGHFLRSILALAETRGGTRRNFRARGASQNPTCRLRPALVHLTTKLQLWRNPAPPPVGYLRGEEMPE